jgi:sugar lactone lactonase YvrE
MNTARQILSMSVVLATTALVVASSPSLIEAQSGVKAAKGKPAAATVDRPPVWPLPPEQPRIRYVTSYRGVGDFKSKKSSGWKNFLFGSDDAALKLPDSLVKPYGVAVSSSGKIYVSDTGSRRVFVFDAERKQVTFIGDRGAVQLAKPTGIAVDASGRIFVADATLNRIFAFAPDGTLVLAIGHDGELDNPAGIAIDGERQRVYVADSTKHRVFCYSTVDGSPVLAIGRRGGEPGEFNFPTNLFVDGQGRLFVADTLNFRVQAFDADGKLLSVFGTLGDTPGSFNRPKGIGVDGEGHIYVADTSFNNFQIFDQAGQLLLFVGSAGHGPGEFFLPAGLSVDGRDRIYVVDQGNARVQVFQYLRAAAK